MDLKFNNDAEFSSEIILLCCQVFSQIKVNQTILSLNNNITTVRDVTELRILTGIEKNYILKSIRFSTKRFFFMLR